MSLPQTITGQFLALVESSPNNIAFKERTESHWGAQTFAEWRNRSRAIAAALISDGIKPQDSVSVFSYSRRQWLEADMAILLCGAKTATIYQNLAGEAVDYIINDSKAKIVFAEGPVQLQSIFGEDKKKELPECLTKVVYFESLQRPASGP